MRYLSSFDQYFRYPYVENTGEFSLKENHKMVIDLIHKIRRDIHIIKDDYPLGILIRGGFQRKISKESWDINKICSESLVVAALAILFKDKGVDSLVKWGRKKSARKNTKEKEIKL